MSFFKKIAMPAALVLTVVSMGPMTAQAQSGKRMVVAMAPADVSPSQDAKPARAAAPTVVRKRVAVVAAPKAAKEDCFWCNRPVYISGLTY